MKKEKILLGILVLLSLNIISAAPFGYDSAEGGVTLSSVNLTAQNNTYYVNGTSLIGGGYYLYNDTISIYLNDTRLNKTIDARVSGAEADPFWSGNYSLYNSSWSSIFNQTYQDAWLYTINNSFYPYTSNPFGYLNASADSFAGNYSTFLTHINWGQATNGTLALNISLVGYYPVVNPYTYWNSTFATFNKTYADTLYYGIGNPSSYITWANAVNGTLALNSSLAGYYPLANPLNFTNKTLLSQFQNDLLTTEPLWSANLTAHNSTWNSINNATYNEAWLLATNGTFYKRITNEFNYTNKTLLSQFGNDLTFYVDNTHSYFNTTNFPNYANVYLNTTNQYNFTNKTLLSQFTNDLTFYLDNTHSYFNTTNFPNYANVYLNTTNQFSYYNSTSLIELDPYWSSNLTIFLNKFNATNFPNYANVYLNTTNQYNFTNKTLLSQFQNDGVFITWDKVINGTIWGQVLNGTVMKQTTYDTNYSTLRLVTNQTFSGTVTINSNGNLNVSSGNSTVFLGRIKLGIDSQNCGGLVSGEICRNATAVYIKG